MNIQSKVGLKVGKVMLNGQFLKMKSQTFQFIKKEGDTIMQGEAIRLSSEGLKPRLCDGANENHQWTNSY